MSHTITDDLGRRYKLGRWRMRQLDGPGYRMSRRQLRKAFERIANGDEMRARARYGFGFLYFDFARAWVRKHGDSLRIGCCEFEPLEALTLQQWAEGYI